MNRNLILGSIGLIISPIIIVQLLSLLGSTGAFLFIPVAIGYCYLFIHLIYVYGDFPCHRNNNCNRKTKLRKDVTHWSMNGREIAEHLCDEHYNEIKVKRSNHE